MNMHDELANQEFREMLAERIRALGDPTRILLLHELMKGEKCVHELADIVGKSQATVSKHLAILHRHGFLQHRREGVQTFYRIGNSSMQTFCELMCESLKKHLSNMAKVSASE